MRRLLLVAFSRRFCRAASSRRRTDFREQRWDHVPPAQSGWSEAALADVQDWSKQIHSTAVMVVHRGAVVAEWGDTAAKTPLASVRKSLLSALIGIAVERGEIDLSRTIGALGIDDNEPSLTAEEKSATVRDLLISRSGIYHAALYESRPWRRSARAAAATSPARFWYYNNWDFNTLGTIYEHAVRSSIFDAFEREIARPIGMQDYRPPTAIRHRARPRSIRAYPLRMSARDLARFGLLYLNKGAGRASRSCRPTGCAKARVPIRSNPAPGSAMAICGGPRRRHRCPAGIPEGTFMAWGAGGQHAFVVPAYDLVVVNRVDRDQQLPEPRLSEVKQLLSLTLKAGPFGR